MQQYKMCSGNFIISKIWYLSKHNFDLKKEKSLHPDLLVSQRAKADQVHLYILPLNLTLITRSKLNEKN